MPTIEGLRDATVQQLADWTDARWGVGCFSIARCCMVVAGTVPTLCDLVASRVAGSDAMLLDFLWQIPCAVGMLAVAGHVGSAARRPPSSALAKALPPYRCVAMVTGAAMLLVAYAWLWLAIGAQLWREVAVNGPDSTDARVHELVLTGMSFALGWPLGLLFASCVWKGLPRARRPAKIGHRVPALA